MAEVLYDEQRKNKFWFKFIAETRSKEISVKRVDGDKLVFNDGKIYVPPTLRQETALYYMKKHPRHTLYFMEKHVYWLYMEDNLQENASNERNVRVSSSGPSSRRGSC